MAIGTAAAILGSAVIGAGANALAADSAADASKSASKASIAAQQQQAAQTRADNAPFMQAGYGAVNALTGRLGLSGGGATGGVINETPAGLYLPGSTTKAGASGFSTADLGVIREANPGIVDAYNTARATADPNSPAFQQAGLGSLDDYTKHWYDDMRNPADYTYQPAAQQQPSTAVTTGGAQPGSPGYVPSGTYGNATNPTYEDPGEFSYALDDYTASPAYQYTVDQALKGVESSAANAGALRSGATLKALQDRAANLAYQDFNNERNFARASYDTDRAYDRGVYQDDRNYLTGRYDTETGNLFDLTRIGQSAANGTAASGQSSTNGIVNALQTNATNQGNASIAGANAINSLLGSGVNALTYGQAAKTPTLAQAVQQGVNANPLLF